MIEATHVFEEKVQLKFTPMQFILFSCRIHASFPRINHFHVFVNPYKNSGVSKPVAVIRCDRSDMYLNTVLFFFFFASTRYTYSNSFGKHIVYLQQQSLYLQLHIFFPHAPTWPWEVKHKHHLHLKFHITANYLNTTLVLMQYLVLVAQGALSWSRMVPTTYALKARWCGKQPKMNTSEVP